MILQNIISLSVLSVVPQLGSNTHRRYTGNQMMTIKWKASKISPSPTPPSDHDDTNQTTFTSSVPPPLFECADIRKLLSFDQTNHLRTNTQWRSSQMDRRYVTCKRGLERSNQGDDKPGLMSHVALWKGMGAYVLRGGAPSAPYGKENRVRRWTVLLRRRRVANRSHRDACVLRNRFPLRFHAMSMWVLFFPFLYDPIGVVLFYILIVYGVWVTICLECGIVAFILAYSPDFNGSF